MFSGGFVDDASVVELSKWTIWTGEVVEDAGGEDSFLSDERPGSEKRFDLRRRKLERSLFQIRASTLGLLGFCALDITDSISSAG